MASATSLGATIAAVGSHEDDDDDYDDDGDDEPSTTFDAAQPPSDHPEPRPRRLAADRSPVYVIAVSTCRCWCRGPAHARTQRHKRLVQVFEADAAVAAAQSPACPPLAPRRRRRPDDDDAAGAEPPQPPPLSVRRLLAAVTDFIEGSCVALDADHQLFVEQAWAVRAAVAAASAEEPPRDPTVAEPIGRVPSRHQKPAAATSVAAAAALTHGDIVHCVRLLGMPISRPGARVFQPPFERSALCLSLGCRVLHQEILLMSEAELFELLIFCKRYTVLPYGDFECTPSDVRVPQAVDWVRKHVAVVAPSGRAPNRDVPDDSSRPPFGASDAEDGGAWTRGRAVDQVRLSCERIRRAVQDDLMKHSET